MKTFGYLPDGAEGRTVYRRQRHYILTQRVLGDIKAKLFLQLRASGRAGKKSYSYMTLMYLRCNSVASIYSIPAINQRSHLLFQVAFSTL